MTQEINRLNMLGETLARDSEWGTALGAAYGIIIPKQRTLAEFRKISGTGHRDGAFFMPTRVFIVSPKASPGLLSSLWSAMRGDVKGAAEKSATTAEIRRSDVVKIERHQSAPKGWALTGGEFISVDGKGQVQLLMWIDTKASDMGRLDRLSEKYPTN